LKGIWAANGRLEVELLERLVVFFPKLVLYSHLLGHDMDLLDRLGEEVPDETPVGKLVSIGQAGGKLRRAQYVGAKQLASRGKEEWEAHVLDLTLARALQPQANRKELNVVVFGYYQLFFLAHDRQELQEGEIKASLEPKELSARNVRLMNCLEDKS